MNGIEWSTILANAGIMGTTLVAMMGGFWALVRRQTHNLIAETAVSTKLYREEQLTIKADIEQLKKSDAEFRVIKLQIETIQRGQTELKLDMNKGLTDLRHDLQEGQQQQREELSGGLNSLREQMTEYTKLATRKP